LAIIQLQNLQFKNHANPCEKGLDASSPFSILEVFMAKQPKVQPKKKVAASTSKVIASVTRLLGGQDAVKVAASQILSELGVSAPVLLRAKAAEFEEMAELIEAAQSEPETEADDAEAEDAEAEDAEAEDAEAEDAEAEEE
jgi:hypothetical protein